VTTFNLVNAAMTGMFLLICLMRAALPERAASGGLVAVEALALGVGALGVRLGAGLVRRFDLAAVPESTGGLAMVADEATTEVPFVVERRAA
jgi:hypothetical protein